MSRPTLPEPTSTTVRPLGKAPIGISSVRRLGCDEIEAVAVDRWENEGGRWVCRLTSMNDRVTPKPH